MAECKIMKCTCNNDFQDETYGKYMRVFNPAGKGSSQGDYYICATCGKSTSGSSKSKK